MKLSREKILRMFNGTGSGSGGSVDIDGVASESWVGSKYLSKDFIAQTINWYDGADIVIPNDTKSDIDLIEFAVNASFRGDLNVLGNLTMAGRLVATQEWVGRNYVSISFFDAVFQVFNNTTKIAVNGDIPADTSKMNIKAMFGFWTDFYVTALGRGIAQPTVVNVLNDLADVSLVSPLTNGQALVYSSSLGKWTNGEPTAGTVTRIGMTVPSGFTVSPAAITSSGTFAITFASGYSLPTNTKQSNWDAAYTDRHTHSNKTVLDGISATKVSNWDAAYTDRHTHSNKTVLDGISSTKVSNWDAAYADRHTHSNKTVLDGITAAKVSNWDAAYSKALVLESYFDANGNAKSALKLTTVNKTAWGQTYWTSGGVPTSISGNMTDVGDITMNGSNRINPNGNALYIGNENNASWVFISDCCSSDGSSWKIRHGGTADFANVYSAGYVTALSDIRYKDVVDRFYLDAETIAQTSVIRFKMKDGDDKRTHAGGIAQEWQKILPEVVVEDERGRLSMDYGTIGMIASVSLAREIRKLKEEIKILRKQLGR